jgi:CDP-glucose 4,6-dehydratase
MVGGQPDFWRGRSVLVTGHTGFIGGWLCWRLLQLGAQVHGLALAPSTNPSLFALTDLASQLHSHQIVDLRDAAATDQAVAQLQSLGGQAPSVVLHLAAQPLVRDAFYDPVSSFATNVMGTVHLLQALRGLNSLESLVVMTTDKVYLNREWVWDYREEDGLGGYEPYGCSKAGQEMVAAAYRHSYFLKAARPVGLATVRAGNVIGGGDFSANRLVPDLVRAVMAGQALAVRNPHAVRPWQHVIAVVDGLLKLAHRLADEPLAFSQAWNFGPPAESVVPVAELVQRCCQAWNQTAAASQSQASWQNLAEPNAPYEASLLDLSSRKAQQQLDWRPAWLLQDAIEHSVAWYQHYANASDVLALRQLCWQQLALFSAQPAGQQQQ